VKLELPQLNKIKPTIKQVKLDLSLRQTNLNLPLTK